ncbi:MAG: hypothetical protein QOD53_843, partial [Thermoleophilaceae bacterium]|nr:hypothetical protein [Thermoleophilaceae bacterium]
MSRRRKAHRTRAGLATLAILVVVIGAMSLAGTAAASPGARPKIRLSVTPTRAHTGRGVRFRFTVHSKARRCRRGVSIRFGKRKRAHTDRRGRALVKRRFGGTGRRGASARKRGCRAGFASVRVKRHGSGSSRTLYVSAAAGKGGDGSHQRPFNTLAAAESASRAGEEIVVLPSAANVPPLEGGIALKAGQRLIGGGSSVAGVKASAAAPRVSNSSSARHAGDAIVLADRVEVSNIAVVGAYRGGIYGRDVKDVYVHGNDVTATNTSCTTGFIVQPFQLPTTAPGVGVPFSSGLSNGWAAIMVDQTRTKTHVRIDRNSVHDAGCADGIDVRASGTTNVQVRANDNALTRLKQDPPKESILALGMQTTDGARLTADVNGNRESYIGTASENDFGEADSEGLFANAAGRSKLVERVDRNTFAHGLGHISANCFEVVASNGGPTLHATLRNSTCDYVVGDILEAANLSQNATLTF